jgi:hypothetical protein
MDALCGHREASSNSCGALGSTNESLNTFIFTKLGKDSKAQVAVRLEPSARLKDMRSRNFLSRSKIIAAQRMSIPGISRKRNVGSVCVNVKSFCQSILRVASE